MNTNDQNLRFSLIQQGCLVALYDKYTKIIPNKYTKQLEKTTLILMADGWHDAKCT